MTFKATDPTRCLSAIVVALLPALADARGASPYLPLDLAPRVERQIERLLILAGKPVMRRPIPLATVLDALSGGCKPDPALCEEVRGYLQPYMGKFDVTHARAEGRVTSGDSLTTLPNRHGEPVDSSWRVAARAYWQPSDYVILNAGGVAYDGEATATGSFLSAGFHFAQLDIGYRDHWLGPMSDSSLLISTEAPTMLSATLSNYVPFTRFGFNYEIFGAETSTQSNIAFQGGTTEGEPRLAGLQLGMEPAPGYAVSVNRITQYGGGARGRRGVSDFWDALLTSTNRPDLPGAETAEENRIASLASNMLFAGPVPFGVRIEYAGEDNTYDGKYRLGRTNVSLGIDLPLLPRGFDASYEVSDFQKGWYAHHIYPQGPRNEERAVGHWFADQRLPDDDIGGYSHLLRVGWRLPRGDYAQASYRSLEFDHRWAFDGIPRPYQPMQVLELNYSTQWAGYPIDARIEVGEDAFGESFARLGAAFDFASTRIPNGFSRGEVSRPPGTEFFVDAGVQYSRAREILLLPLKRNDITEYEANYHVGFGARRAVSARQDLGVRLELDDVAERTLVSVRALDYRFRFNRRFAVGAFFGVGRYNISLDAHGYLMGFGLQYRDLLPGWDVGLDYRRFDKLNRDRGYPNDPASNLGLPRRYIDIYGPSLYLSRRF